MSIGPNLDTPMDTITDLLQAEHVCSRRSSAACFFLVSEGSLSHRLTEQEEELATDLTHDRH